MTRIDIFQLMKDKDYIQNLDKRLMKINSFAMKKNKNIDKISFYSAFCFVLATCYIWLFPLDFSNIEDINVKNFNYFFGYLLGILLPIIPSYISGMLFQQGLFFFAKKKLKVIKKEFLTKKLEYFSNILYDNPYTNKFLRKFENRLSDKDRLYLKNFPVSLNKNDVYYSMFSSSIKNCNDKELIENNEKIVEFIKDNFNVKKQKKLIEDITITIKENSIDSEICFLKKVLNERLEEEKEIIKLKEEHKVMIQNI